MNRRLLHLALAVCAGVPTAASAQAEPPRPETRAQAVEGKVYAPGPFDKVVIDGAGQVRLVQSDRDEVFVPGGPDAQDDVDVRLVRGSLHVDLPGGWKFWRRGGSLVEIRVRRLSRLMLEGANDVVAPEPFTGDTLAVGMAGSGQVRFDQLRFGQVSFDISGAGEGVLNGQVDRLRVSVSGKGKIGAAQLKADSAVVAISGVGDASLWVVKDLRVRISGAGHVTYWGQPTVSKSIEGFGSVDARGDR